MSWDGRELHWLEKIKPAPRVKSEEEGKMEKKYGIIKKDGSYSLMILRGMGKTETIFNEEEKKWFYYREIFFPCGRGVEPLKDLLDFKPINGLEYEVRGRFFIACTGRFMTLNTLCSVFDENGKILHRGRESPY